MKELPRSFLLLYRVQANIGDTLALKNTSSFIAPTSSDAKMVLTHAQGHVSRMSHNINYSKCITLSLHSCKARSRSNAELVSFDMVSLGEA